MENNVTEEPEAIIALSQFSHGQKEFEAYQTLVENRPNVRDEFEF
jgi:hypothetical protein